MPVRFTFTRDHDHPVGYGIDVSYKAGTTVLVPEAHADGAEAAKAGTREKPSDGKGQKPKGEGAGAERG